MSSWISTITNQSRMSVMLSGAALQLEADLSGARRRHGT